MWRGVMLAVLAALSASALGADRRTSLHTNFFYYGDVKEIYSAYLDRNGEPVKHGWWRDWDEAGNLWHEIWFQDGKPDGTNITYYSNGQKEHEAFVVNGRYHGVTTTWNRDGGIVARGTRNHDRFWPGTFVVETMSSSHVTHGHEDFEFKVAEFRKGERLPGEPKIVFDDGKKWIPKPASPDYRRYLRWNRYPYEIESAYPYLKTLPPLSKIPKLLEWMNKEGADAGIEVAYSQLVALSRADFGHPQQPPYGGMPSESESYHRKKRDQAWRNWWQNVGQSLNSRTERHGQWNAEAWKLVSKREQLPVQPVTIPDEWALRTSFHTGDYFGVITETITLIRKKHEARLIRGIRRGKEAPLEWEHWAGLTIKEADDFAFALAYAIDHPWLLMPDEANADSSSPPGRDFGLYYPYFRYEFTDLEGNVWWNDSPVRWYGDRRNTTNLWSVADGVGPVCLLLWRCFPEIPTGREASRGKWTPVASTNRFVAELMSDDLRLRGEILETVDHSERLRDALKAMEQFGTQRDISVIEDFETELPARFGGVGLIVEQDPNGQHEIATVTRLLEQAAEAKAAITRRDPRPLVGWWRVENLIVVLLVGWLMLRLRRIRQRGV